MEYAHLAPRSLYDFPPIRLSLFAYLAGMSRCTRANHHVYMCFELRHLRLELTGQTDGTGTLGKLQRAGLSWRSPSRSFPGPCGNLHLTYKYTRSNPECGDITWMPSKDKDQIQLLQGTLDLIVLRTLATMGSQHAYQIATRLQQISDRLLNLNQGTLYPALVRLEQYGWIKGTWGKTENNREAKYYEITKAGQKAVGAETQKWRTMAALVERLLLEES